MAKPRANPRLAKIHRNYTVEEIATLYSVHRHTVRQWIKAGLPVVDQRRPVLVLGAALAEYLRIKRTVNKRPCRPGEIYCMRCREPRVPAGADVRYHPITPTQGNLVGLCPSCSAGLFRRVSAGNLGQFEGLLRITLPPAEEHIGKSTGGALAWSCASSPPQTVTSRRDNERIKRQYFAFLKEAKRQSEDSVDAVAKALARFGADTQHRDFRTFHFEQAVAFKRRLADRDSQVTGEKLSKATLNSTLAYLKRFFQWLALQPGYKSRLNYSDAEYFNLSEKDTRVATARRERPAPTLDQVKHVIATMPAATEIERRNRALVAFALLTGARDGALATLRLKHLDIAAGSVYQDARDVATKASKSFTTYFFPVGPEVLQIVEDWVKHLRQQKLWGNDDPLFPATRIELGVTRHFEATGIDRKAWSTASPIRAIFKQAFEAAGLPYFNPHSFRRTLAQLGETMCQTPEQFKAWSQNLGHEGVLTTFYSYGSVAERRQGELIRSLAQPKSAPAGHADELARAVLVAMRREGLLSRNE